MGHDRCLASIGISCESARSNANRRTDPRFHAFTNFTVCKNKQKQAKTSKRSKLSKPGNINMSLTIAVPSRAHPSIDQMSNAVCMARFQLFIVWNCTADSAHCVRINFKLSLCFKEFTHLEQDVSISHARMINAMVPAQVSWLPSGRPEKMGHWGSPCTFSSLPHFVTSWTEFLAAHSAFYQTRLAGCHLIVSLKTMPWIMVMTL